MASIPQGFSAHLLSCKDRGKFLPEVMVVTKTQGRDTAGATQYLDIQLIRMNDPTRPLKLDFKVEGGVLHLPAWLTVGREDFQKIGLGRLVMQQCISWARSLREPPHWVAQALLREVGVRNSDEIGHRNRFYHKLGFKVCDREAGQTSDDLSGDKLDTFLRTTANGCLEDGPFQRLREPSGWDAHWNVRQATAAEIVKSGTDLVPGGLSRTATPGNALASSIAPPTPFSSR